MATYIEEVAALTNATTALLSAINVKKVVLDAAVEDAVAAAALALNHANEEVTRAAAEATKSAASAAAANISQVAVTGTLAIAASSAAQAATARDQALQAWAASTYPMETLASISKSIHYGAVVKAIIYDTGKDSDGGVWRKRCQGKSWYTEALGFTGTWRDQRATTAAAWAVSGAAAGDGFQNTMDGKYYVLTGTTTASEIFRGNVREFPEVVAIIAEATRVIIYDLTQVGCPMWMVFERNTYSSMLGESGFTSIAALNGVIVAGDINDLYCANFIKDSGVTYSTTSSISGTYRFPISNRNTTGTLGSPSYYWTFGTVGNIADRTINDVAITVLDGAPIDPATRLPVPTIAVATAGGISVIKDDGTVVNINGGFGATDTYFVGFDADNNILSSGYWTERIAVFPIPIANTTYSSVLREYNFAGSGPVILGAQGIALSKALGVGKGRLANHSYSGITLIKENPTTPTKGMVAYITDKYSSGWQVGDSRLATLADTVAETITGGELVTNGTFTTDTDWTKGTGWTISGGVASHSGAAGYLTTSASPMIVGKTYIFQATTTGTIIFISSTAGNITLTGNVFSFVAADSQLTFWANTDSTIDNVSCKLAEPDRSVKNNGLILNGTLQKTAVAAGANLVAYSGFSAANYLEQPYNADLDFGTGDFCVMGWYTPAQAEWAALAHRGVTLSADEFVMYVTSAGAIKAQVKSSATGLATPDGSAITGVPVFTVFLRSGTTTRLYANGFEVASTTDTSNINQTTPFRIGLWTTNPSTFAGSLALWRISATAPSADQIAHIYRTELPLFQPGAQCTLDGTSTAVTALAYDDTTDILQVGTSWGRSAFRDLLRVESAVSTVGAITSLSANQGSHITGGASSGKYYQPALLLRDELRRKDEAKKALGKVPVFFDFDAIAGQTAFVLQSGYTAKAVYSAGTLKRNGATKDYTTSTDGFRETVNFGVSPGSAAWVSIMAIRSN